MKNNQIYGQGEDVVGAFTIAGAYKISSTKGNASFQKSYIGKHKVEYKGEITVSDLKCTITGQWEIGTNLKDQFNMQLTLMSSLEKEKNNRNYCRIISTRRNKNNDLLR